MPKKADKPRQYHLASVLDSEVKLGDAKKDTDFVIVSIKAIQRTLAVNQV